MEKNRDGIKQGIKKKILKGIEGRINEINQRPDAEKMFKAEDIYNEAEFNKIRNSLTRRNGRQGFLFVPDLGRKIEINKLTVEKAYIAEIQTLLVKRTFDMGARPYKNEEVSVETYVPVSLYDLPYKKPPDDFEIKEETGQIVPGTENVIKCACCAGEKRITQRYKNQICPVCGGAGKVIRYAHYKTRYFPELFTGVFTPVKIPQKESIMDAGNYIYSEIIHDKMRDAENGLTKLAELGYLNTMVKNLVSYMEELLKKETDTAVFKIRLSIKEIKLKKIEYTFRSKRQTIWLIGDDNLLYAGGKLIGWRKVFFIVSTGLFIFAGGLLYISRPDYSVPGRGEKELLPVVKAETAAKSRPQESGDEVVVKEDKKIPEERTGLSGEKNILKRKYLFDKGFSQYKGGDFKESYNNLTAALELNKTIKVHSKMTPATADIYFYLGEALMKFENYEEAVIMYNNVLKENPDHSFAKEKLKVAKAFKYMFERKKNYEKK